MDSGSLPTVGIAAPSYLERPMPMWDFICEKCGKELPDVIVKLDEEPPPCPECGAATEKVTSYKTSFRLKGVSWARDGYKNRKQKR